MEGLEFDKNLKKAITASERKQQKLFLKSVEASIDKTVAKPSKINWFIAASIMALIGLGSYFIIENQSVSNQELYAENFTTYENVVAPIVRNNANRNTKQLAFAYYELGQYQKAIEQFNELTNTENTDLATINFYKANAYLSIKNYKKAKDLLVQIIESNNQKWKNESLWYLGLTYLKLDEKNNAILYIQKLQQQKSFKINEVNHLINEIN
jgi:tetratricopeptide (TPR) repeat protein